MRRPLLLASCLALHCAVDPGGLSLGDGGMTARDAFADSPPDSPDLCPEDPNKTAPGQCGCGVPDTDSDGDGVPDCLDDCPLDPHKVVPGTCGCGETDEDLDGDGWPACQDCDDSDPERFPGATERCNGLDDNCNGVINDGLPLDCGGGCGDGTREALLDPVRYPLIAACAGGWEARGMTTAPRCMQRQGNDAPDPAGIGCAAHDLCAIGWRPCRLADLDGVEIRATDCSSAATTFFAAAVGASGSDCDASSLARVYGCPATALDPPRTAAPTCAPLTSYVERGVLCPEGWDCGSMDALEIATIRASRGGVLCCRAP